MDQEEAVDEFRVRGAITARSGNVQTWSPNRPFLILPTNAPNRPCVAIGGRPAVGDPRSLQHLRKLIN